MQIRFILYSDLFSFVYGNSPSPRASTVSKRGVVRYSEPGTCYGNCI
jgi:hypothetical protein